VDYYCRQSRQHAGELLTLVTAFKANHEQITRLYKSSTPNPTL